MTRADILKSSIVFALSRVKVHIGKRFYDLGLTPTIVEEIATKAIADMRKHGNWKDLDDEVPQFGEKVGPR